MTPEQQKAFETRLDMFSHPGWKDFIEELGEFIDVIDTVNGIKSMEELFIRKGKVELSQWITNLQSITESTYKQSK